MRQPSSQAATTEELHKWPAFKLVTEVTKQIRRDYGGRNAQVVLKERAMNRFGFDEDQAKRAAQFAYIIAGEATDGCRRRVRSKLIEILDRLEIHA